MKHGSTIFLRGVVFLIGIAVLAIYVFALPWLAGVAADWLPAYTFLRVLALTVWYATAVPFYFALYQVFKLLNHIDRNEAFSELSVKALKTIKYCAVSVSVLFMASLPTVYFLAQADDAPGLCSSV
jgi:hypothetical protein